MMKAVDFASGIWSFLNLKWLDGIKGEDIPNSVAFKLGALSGCLPALSVVAIGSSKVAKDQAIFEALTGNAVSTVLASALIGASVSFFLAENRLKEIFTYGITGPSLVLAIYGSSLANMNATERIDKIEGQLTQALNAKEKSENASIKLKNAFNNNWKSSSVEKSGFSKSLKREDEKEEAEGIAPLIN